MCCALCNRWEERREEKERQTRGIKDDEIRFFEKETERARRLIAIGPAESRGVHLHDDAVWRKRGRELVESSVPIALVGASRRVEKDRILLRA